MDQLGARSLYWARVRGGIAFAADLRDLLALLPTSPAPERAELLRFLAARVVDAAGLTACGRRAPSRRGLLRLGERPRVRRYWEPRTTECVEAPVEELAGLVRERVLAAVRRRRLPDGRSRAHAQRGSGLHRRRRGPARARRGARGHVSAYSGVVPRQPRDRRVRRDRAHGALDGRGLGTEPVSAAAGL